MLVTINSLSSKGRIQFWTATNSGEFYVRIAYQLEKERQCVMRGKYSIKLGYNRACGMI
jgi:hypothetical protein